MSTEDPTADPLDEAIAAEQDAADLAETLRDVHQAFLAALSAGLTRRALAVLIRDLNPDLHLRQINGVLDALGDLDRYLDDGEGT